MATPERLAEHQSRDGYRPGRFKAKPLDGGRPLWHKQVGESVQAYEAFMIYLTLPAEDRSIPRVAEITDKSVSCMNKWSGQWSWRVRIGAYEEHFLLMRLDSVEADRDRMWREQAELASSAIGVVGAALSNLTSQIDDNRLSAEHLRPEALTRLLDTATKIQRMAILGRAELADQVKERNAKLEDIWAGELAETLETFMNGLELTQDQQVKAREVLKAVLVGGGGEAHETEDGD